MRSPSYHMFYLLNLQLYSVEATFTYFVPFIDLNHKKLHKFKCVENLKSVETYSLCPVIKLTALINKLCLKFVLKGFGLALLADEI